jgi:hypothetical protein
MSKSIMGVLNKVLGPLGMRAYDWSMRHFPTFTSRWKPNYPAFFWTFGVAFLVVITWVVYGLSANSVALWEAVSGTVILFVSIPLLHRKGLYTVSDWGSYQVSLFGREDAEQDEVEDEEDEENSGVGC